ncbi:MAG TPA: YfcE family phosphodiesterase [Planctomycetota bacterium]|nr:YfcE family phosphodiesterase [Planctomycetota bacterium]
MRIGILSDSHDHLDRLNTMIAALTARKIDHLIHLGDFVAPFAMKRVLVWTGPKTLIYGNNDGEKKGLKKLYPELLDGPVKITLGGVKFGLAHSVEEIPAGYRGECDVILYGHTHNRLIKPAGAGQAMEINPGETCGWLTGKPSAVVFDTAGKVVTWVLPEGE